MATRSIDAYSISSYWPRGARFLKPVTCAVYEVTVLVRRLTVVLSLASLGSAAACNREDIVLGERGPSRAAVDGGAAGASDASGMSGGAGGMVEDAGALESSRPSKGCGNLPGMDDGRIQVDELSASYVLDLPRPYAPNRAYPLVLAFRRNNDTPEAFRKALGLVDAVASEAIVVHPNCLGDASSWEPPRDLPLFDALLSELASTYCIDQDRVFAVGLGGGAFMANAVGCLRGDVLRAIAPLTGVLPPSSCPERTAVWLMQSDADAPIVQLGRENRDFWIAQNGCDDATTAPVAPAPCVEYSACDQRVPVSYCENSADLDVTSTGAGAAWSFFRTL